MSRQSLSHAPSSRDRAVEAAYHRLLDPEMSAEARQKMAEDIADAVIEASGTLYALQVLVCMVTDDEIASVEATFDEEGCDAALAALDAARKQIDADIAAYNGEVER